MASRRTHEQVGASGSAQPSHAVEPFAVVALPAAVRLTAIRAAAAWVLEREDVVSYDDELVVVVGRGPQEERVLHRIDAFIEAATWREVTLVYVGRRPGEAPAQFYARAERRVVSVLGPLPAPWPVTP